MQRRSFMAMLAALLPAGWLGVKAKEPEPEPKVNQAEFYTPTRPTNWSCSLFVGDQLIAEYEMHDGIQRQVFPA